ncbi:endonuclease/exonuclease/phosphatase family protein [Niveibacterium microcysteis]|uniref:Endonuclease/exonuclease/phosphatase family protein n=1 Tax=Niveibacterium microcysteis TaxID=2811415 RepID=A0ABX7M750_9RHOO|nr:endonuclease/exonuclease/phosphatase family protein [Niveibacterium microcysteis]QSI77580.1 endonuclease/exonuclease/phosphatase family protein [Niveibacterium microcysteis]
MMRTKLPLHRIVPGLLALLAATGASAMTIGEVQGTGHLSPYAGRSVEDLRGVVTAVSRNGFWLQDETPDADERSADAVFVYLAKGEKPAVGDRLAVSGRVGEYRPGRNPDNLTITQLDDARWQRLAAGVPLPAPVRIGDGGRLPPTAAIAPTLGNVEAARRALEPRRYAMDFFESLEGMRVEIDDAVAVSARGKRGELVVIAAAQAETGLRSARGALTIAPGAFNPHRILIDDSLAATPAGVKVGDHLRGVRGVVDYAYGSYRLKLTETPQLVSKSLPADAAPALAPGQLAVAAYNVENLGGDAPQARFDALARQIVGPLRAPHLLALEEVQDSSGARDNGVTDATRTLTRLTDAVRAAGGPAYRWIDIAPENNADGGAPGANIRQVILYDPARVQLDGSVGGAKDAVAIGVGGKLQPAAGRIAPSDPAFESSRKPLVAQFTVAGKRLVVVATHFVSKRMDQPLFGPQQPPFAGSEVQRVAQAAVVADFVRTLRGHRADAAIVVLGDFNDFAFGPAAQALEAAGLANLTLGLPPQERYSFIYQGNAQALDHVFVSPPLAGQALRGYQIVHLNAEYPDAQSDHDPVRAVFDIDAIPR